MDSDALMGSDDGSWGRRGDGEKKEWDSMEIVKIRDEFIKLGQAMKLAGLSESGVDAKFAIQDGEVRVNGQVECRRGRKLVDGDVVEYAGQSFRIEA